jgi:hypothetical protein
MGENVTDVRARLRPGKASNFISPVNLRSGDKVVHWRRVSGGEQDRQGNLRRSEANLRRAVAPWGPTSPASWRWCGAATIPCGWAVPWPWRGNTARWPCWRKTTDRFIRSSEYSKTNQAPQARTEDLDHLRYMTDGFPVMTLLDPDASPAEVRAYHTCRGQRKTGRRGGRPRQHEAGYKKRRRGSLRPRAQKLHRVGKSLRQISRELNVPHSTVQGWLKKHG